MKFRILRDHFGHGLSQVLNVVGSKASAPILNNVLIEAEGNDRITLTTTNLDLGIRTTLKATVMEPGALTLPVRKLASIVKELPESDVILETTAGHQARLSSGRSTFKIMGLGREDFPPLADFSDERQLVLPQDALAEMLQQVAYAQSQDETRYMLNGVHFLFGERRLTLVATDGRRLAIVSRALEQPLEKTGSLTLPARSVAELTRLLDQGEKVRIAFNERRVAFFIAAAPSTPGEKSDRGLLDHLLLQSKVAEGNYPNYSQVIPKEAHQRLKLERELLAQSIHRAALVTTDRSNSIKLRLTSNLLEILAASTEYGEAHETLAIDYSGPELTISFNPVYLLDCLRALTRDEVFFEFKDDISPGVIKTLDQAQFTYVVMPVRAS